MKNLLHQHKQTIERLLKDISTTGTTMSRSTMTTALAKVWDEIRACVKILNDARLLQRHLSGVYLQCCLLKWIQKARKQKDQQAVITTFST
jgi:ribonuclease HI